MWRALPCIGGKKLDMVPRPYLCGHGTKKEIRNFGSSGTAVVLTKT